MQKAKKTPKLHEPLHITSQQAGWSPNAKRWLSINGKFVTEQQALAENKLNSDPEQYGGRVKFHFPTPITNNFEILEMNMSQLSQDVGPMTGITGVIKAALDGSTQYAQRMDASYKGALEKWSSPSYQAKLAERNRMNAAQGIDPNPASDKPQPNYMPMQIQTRMQLAEHYYNIDGDATNIVDIPIELLSRSIDVVCTDAKMRKDIEAFIAVNNLEARVAELWSEQREYGQAYPLEVWDGSDLVDVVPMNPKSIHVGYNWAFGFTPEQYGTEQWNEGLIQSVFPPAMYRPLLRHWNDSPFMGPGQGLMLPGENLRPIWDRQRSWMRYSMPMLSKGFRELVDRTVYEDSVRALVEGYRYQLWVIRIGDKDRPPLPGEISAAKSVLNGDAGDKTGMIVWRDPFQVEVHVPKGLQEMISNDYWGGITKQFYRKMGITSQVVSGETPGTLGSSGGKGASASKGDVDVVIYLERCRYQAQQVTNWLTYLVKKWVGLQGGKYPKKALDTLKLSFTPTQTEMAERIEKVYGPMYESGALSHRTYVAAAGIKSDVELQYKKDEKPARDDGLLDPPTTFSQKVVNANGETKTVEQIAPAGSPDAQGEARNRAEKRGVGVPSEEVQKRDVIKAAEEMRPINVTVNNPPQTFNMSAPQVDVHVPAQAQPNIDVHVPQAQIDVHVPEQRPPDVNVTVPTTIQAAEQPNVTVNIPKQDQPYIIVNPPAPANVQFDVHVPEQVAPVVNVAAAEVHIPEQPAPVIHVEAAQIHIPKQDSQDIVINVPEQKAPVVNVAPAITVKSPDVTVIVPETEEEIEVTERNVDGSMKKATKTRRRKGSG